MAFNKSNLFITATILVCCFNLMTAQNPDDACLKCICHARTGCFRMPNCGSYSIDFNYWQRAGMPSVPGISGNLMQLHQFCISNEDCVRRTMRGFFSKIQDKDCTGDGIVDCNDYLLLHLLRDNCKNKQEQKKIINMNVMLRYDSCTNMYMGSNKPKRMVEFMLS